MAHTIDNPAPCPTGYIPVYAQVGEAHYRLSAPVRQACPCDDPRFCSFHGCARKLCAETARALSAGAIRTDADERRLQHARAI